MSANRINTAYMHEQCTRGIRGSPEKKNHGKNSGKYKFVALEKYEFIWFARTQRRMRAPYARFIRWSLINDGGGFRKGKVTIYETRREIMENVGGVGDAVGTGENGRKFNDHERILFFLSDLGTNDVILVVYDI